MLVRKYSICLGCMREKGQAEVCPFCGYREGTPPAAPHYLAPGTILAGKYLIGRGLGHGGFGTTYIARDQVLGIKLAIKEYMPQDCASRAPGSNMVTPFSGEGAKRFADGLESFLQEARTLARFDGSPNIVGVRDFFTENGTAYLVMNYLEGITLKQYLVRSGGKPVPFNKMLGILLPVMDALRTVHAAGLLHRDVSPDNIFLTTSGQVTLIDFGAARQSMGAQTSMSVILKPGYAPEEQYRSRGHQGPWTDIYALGATMYRTLTGKIPPESLERLNNDCLVPPSRLGIAIPPQAEAAILRAMAVRAEDRFQTVDEFRAALLQGAQGAGRPQAGALPAAGVRTPAAGSRPSAGSRPPAGGRPAAGGRTPAGQRAAEEDDRTYPLPHRGGSHAKKSRGPRPAVVVTFVALSLAIALVVGFFLYLSSAVEGEPFPGGISLQSPQNSALTEATPTPDAGAQETPAESATPTPSPTPDPNLGPFDEGAVPSASLSAFVPRAGRILVIEDENATVSWVTGSAPSARPEMLCAQFAYDPETGSPQGDVYGYYLDAGGNLRFASVEAGGSDVLVLPANCAVGMEFSGEMGQSRVVAVNYSGTAGGMELSNCVVVECGEGYAFYQVDKGLVLVQTGMDSGEVLHRLVSDEADTQNIYDAFVE